jgi:hypothetical protein
MPDEVPSDTRVLPDIGLLVKTKHIHLFDKTAGKTAEVMTFPCACRTTGDTVYFLESGTSTKFPGSKRSAFIVRFKATFVEDCIVDESMLDTHFDMHLVPPVAMAVIKSQAKRTDAIIHLWVFKDIEPVLPPRLLDKPSAHVWIKFDLTTTVPQQLVGGIFRANAPCISAPAAPTLTLLAPDSLDSLFSSDLVSPSTDLSPSAHRPLPPSTLTAAVHGATTGFASSASPPCVSEDVLAGYESDDAAALMSMSEAPFPEYVLATSELSAIGVVSHNDKDKGKKRTRSVAAGGAKARTRTRSTWPSVDE